MKKQKGLFWHVHHNRLLEYCYNYQERVDYIKNHKPEHERKLRLRLFQPVQGKLPAEVVEACIAYREAYIAYSKASTTYGKACTVCDEAYVARQTAFIRHKAEINSLHERECPDCPWDGKTIFN